VKIDGCVLVDRLEEMPEAARRSEVAGFDGVWTLENAHDIFLRLALAAEHTERVELTTAIAVAFARSPMTVAVQAWDLQELSHGRFVLGLGTQVKAHVERRFSMPWSTPAPRIREFVHAVRAIWKSWATGAPLDFQGDHYTHTLMAPMFDPGPNPFGDAKVFLAGVGPVMTAVAGEVGDGWIAHPFSTERFLKTVSVPALEKGLAREGRSRRDFEVTCPLMVVTGRDESEMLAMRERVRHDIAFHASTYAYRPILELHGWGDLQTELHQRVKQGAWDTMADAVDDEIVRTFAVVGEPDELPELIRRRLGGVADRISFYPAECNDPTLWEPILADLREIPAGSEVG
jgi:probable F420-dependent oxidoreductase